MGLLRRAKDPRAGEPELSETSIAPQIERFSARLVALTDVSDIPGLLGAPGAGVLLDRVGTAARCLQLCAQQIAAQPLRYRRDTPAPAGRDYAPPWVSSPDPNYFPNGIADVVFASVWSMYAQGDAFLYATTFNADGYPATFTVLDPLALRVDLVAGGRTYDYNGTPLDPSRVLQITRNPTPGALRGTGALQAYAANLTAAFAADGYAADIVGGGGVPPAVIKSARRLTADQASEVQAQWRTKVLGRGASPAVLPPDLDFEQLAFSPKDLTLLESREYDSKQIAAAFGVPAPLLNMTLAGGLTYANPAALFDLWWRSELTPAGKRIEAALTRWLPRGSWVEFDPKASLQPDFAGLTSTYLALLAAKVVSEDEVRAAVLDLPPLAEGDALDLIDEPAGASSSTGSDPIVPAVEPVPRMEVVQ